MDTIVQHARNNRRNPTEPEIRLWRRLSNSQLGGYKFRRQHVIGRRILDFFCPAVALGVEVDGLTHDQGTDSRSDAAMKSEGITIIRFSNHDVMTNLEGVLLSILDVAGALPPRWPGADVLHPNPSSEEEGFAR